MEGRQRWLGWIGIGLGALALAITLFGGSFGSQLGFAGGPGMNMQQQSAQQQNIGPGTNAQPGAGRQNAGRQNAGPQAGPGANAQPGAGQQNTGPQAGPGQQNTQPGAGQPSAGRQNGPGGQARGGTGRQGGGGFGMGGGLRFPFRMIGLAFQWAMLALLIGLGVWMLRRRNPSTAPARAEPVQSAPPAPLSPTGEAYTEEPGEGE